MSLGNAVDGGQRVAFELLVWSMATEVTLPPSAIALGKYVDEHGSKPFEGIVHRTGLWHFKTGSRKPDSKTATEIERVTGGLVPANGWYTDGELKSPAA